MTRYSGTAQRFFKVPGLPRGDLPGASHGNRRKAGRGPDRCAPAWRGPLCIHIGRRMRRIAMQSAVGGMAISMIGMLIAAAGYLRPILGAVAQEVIDVAPVLNALRVAFPSDELSGDNAGYDRVSRSKCGCLSQLCWRDDNRFLRRLNAFSAWSTQPIGALKTADGAVKLILERLALNEGH